MTSSTDPAHDPVGTVRVHPADNPSDPDARRVIRTDEPPTFGTKHMPWDLLTGNDGAGIVDLSRSDDDVAGWPVQPLWQIAVVCGHSAPAATSG